MKTEQMKRRIKALERLNAHLGRLTHSVSEKTPTFKGKASLIDRLVKASRMCHNVGWDLERDLEEWRDHGR